jgi:hypothetical protein
MSASPLAPVLKVVRCSPSNPDPAISEAMIEAPAEAGEKLSPLARYISTRDEALLVFNEGITPTWFHLRRLPAAWLASALDQVYPHSLRRIVAFRAGCHAIEGTPEQTLAVLPPKSTGTFVATKSDFGVTLAPEAWVQEVADVFGAEVVQEMGELIITHSRLRRGAQGPFGSWGESVASR